MNTRYTVGFRRKREGKTNYHKRIKLLSSRSNIIIFRKLSRTVIGQIVKFDVKGDIVLAGVNSRELEKYGWKLSRKNMAAAYLSGFLLAKKAASKKVGELVANFGIINPSKGSSSYAFLKGAVDGGLKIAHEKEALAKDERARGMHIETFAAKNQEKTRFSKTPDAKKISKFFDETKKKIESM